MRKIWSKWYIYLTTVAVVVTSFCIAVSFKTAPKRTERVDFFIGAYDIKTEELKKEIEKKKPSGVVEVELRFHYISSKDFTYIFANFRANVDCFILPYDYVSKNENDSVKYAANLDMDYMNSEFGKENVYYKFEDRGKGIKIYDAATKTGSLTNYIQYDTDDFQSDYYLFFSYKSVNLGKNNDSETDRAIKMAKELIQL